MFHNNKTCFLAFILRAAQCKRANVVKPARNDRQNTTEPIALAHQARQIVLQIHESVIPFETGFWATSTTDGTSETRQPQPAPAERDLRPERCSPAAHIVAHPAGTNVPDDWDLLQHFSVRVTAATADSRYVQAP